MKAVIPCAAKEESLFPFTESKPTGLMPVMGKPLVRHLIEDLRAEGIDEIFLVINHLEDEFRREFGDSEDVNLVEQEELNGTASAVEECSFIEEDFLVVNGDVVTSRENIRKLIEKHENSGAGSTLLASGDDSPEKFGVLSIKNDRVENIQEKPEEPENTLVNTGIYIFNPGIFDVIADMEGEEKHLTDALAKLLENQKITFELVDDYWIDIGSLKQLWRADKTKREHEIRETEISNQAEMGENVHIKGNAVVEKGAEVKPGTVIEGKVYIGEGSVIGPNTVLKGSSVGRDCQVRNATVEESLLFEKNIIDPYTSVEKSVLGEESDIKSNTVVRQSFIGARSFVEMNNSIRDVKFVPDARTDLGEISK